MWDGEDPESLMEQLSFWSLSSAANCFLTVLLYLGLYGNFLCVWAPGTSLQG